MPGSQWRRRDGSEGILLLRLVLKDDDGGGDNALPVLFPRDRVWCMCVVVVAFSVLERYDSAISVISLVAAGPHRTAP